MADIMGVVREIAEEEGYVPANFNQQIEIVKNFSRLYELNAKYSLWKKIKPTIDRNRKKVKKEIVSNYLSEFELCLDLSLDFIKKYSDSSLLSNILDLINNRYNLYFTHIKDFSKEERKKFVELLVKYEDLLGNFPSSLRELILKNFCNIAEGYKAIDEKNKLEVIYQKIKERYPTSKINLKIEKK